MAATSADLRPMRRVWTAGATLLVLVVLATTLGFARPAAAQTDESAATVERIVVVSAPGLRWADLVNSDLPNLQAFLVNTSTALLSLRTIGSRTGIGEGYVTIGAGNRASVAQQIAGVALEPTEPFEGGTAADAYERRTGRVASGAILHLGLPSVQATNDNFLYGAEPGSFGSALTADGRTAAVIANGDRGVSVPSVFAGAPAVAPEVVPDPAEDAPTGETEEGEEPDEEVLAVDSDDVPAMVAFGEADFGRSAALALMDRDGVVASGDVAHLLTLDPASPYGVRLNPNRVVEAFQDVERDAAVTLVELSDLDRADAYRRQADPIAAEGLWQQALTDSDDLFGRLLDTIDLSTTAVIVLSPAGPRSQESLGVFALATPGSEGGLAQSGTTRRAGYVTLSDIAPTMLDLLGLETPSDMTGTLIANVADVDVDADRFALYADATERSVFRDEATGPVSVTFVIAQILAYGLAAVAISRRRGWIGPVSFLALVILATPTIGFAAGIFEFRHLSLVTYVSGIFAAAVVLASIAEIGGQVLARRWPRTRAILAPLALVSLGWVVLVGDIVTGGRLQIDTVFGYSPIVAGRFAGYGNLAFAIVAAGAVVVTCGGWAVWLLARGEADGSARLQRLGVVLVGGFLGLTIVVDGAPAWGADVGGVLATVPAFAVLILVAMGISLNWRRVAVIGVGTIGVLGVFAAIDLARPEAKRTHLGRLFARLFDGGGIGNIIERKIDSNINILTSSIWTFTIPFALGLMVVLVRRNKGFLRDLQENVPGIRAMVSGGLIVAVLGFALNDSGVAVPAMMFAVLLPYLTYVMLRWPASDS